MLTWILDIVFGLAVSGGLGWWFVHSRRTLARLESFVRVVRAAVESEFLFREPIAEDAELLALVPQLVPIADALVAIGFRRVATLVNRRLDEPTSRGGIGCWLVDPAGTTWACVSISPGSADVLGVTLALYSHAPIDVYYTIRMRLHYPVPWPPYVHTARVLSAKPVADVVARHGKLIATATELVALDTTEALVAELLRVQAAMLAWRRSQSPEGLLEHDLQAILGKRYDEHAPKLSERLVSPLPRATLRQ